MGSHCISEPEAVQKICIIPGGHHKINTEFWTGKIALFPYLGEDLLRGSADWPYTRGRQGKNPVPILSHSVGQEREFSCLHVSIHCRAQVETYGKTGVEMEALTAVQIGLLTIYDMCKAVDRGMVMTDVRVLEKHGGKSGDWSAVT
jgi:hypothetical protein